MQVDPLSLAPRPGKIVTEITTEARERKKDPSKPGIYVPPKLAATVPEVGPRPLFIRISYIMVSRRIRRKQNKND